MSLGDRLRGTSRRWRVRTGLMALSLILFLPPLAVVPQLFGETGFCGTWCPRMFLQLDPPPYIFLATFMGVALVAVVLVVTLFAGRYFCSHVCPIGGSTELASRLLPDRVKIRYDGVHAPSVRYAYLLVYLLVPLVGIGSLCCRYCNFAVIPRLLGSLYEPANAAYLATTMGATSALLIAGLMGVLARGGRGHCNLMCPVGAIDSLVNGLGSRLGFRRIRVDADRCNGCGLCLDVCPVWALELTDPGTARISQLSCIPCGRCEDACPEEAIHRVRRR